MWKDNFFIVIIYRKIYRMIDTDIEAIIRQKDRQSWSTIDLASLTKESEFVNQYYSYMDFDP